MTRDRGPPLARANRDGLAPVWDELARRMSASQRPVTAIRLRGLQPAQRAAIADLLGLDRLPPTDYELATAHIAAALNVDQFELRAIVAELRGPLTDRAAARITGRTERAELWTWFEECLSAWNVEGWINRLRRAGIPADDVWAHRERLRQLIAVLTRLPADNVSLPRLAQDALGDPHALDQGTWAGGAVLDAIACQLDHAPPRTAQQGRVLWGRMGVLADSLSPSVLVLGLESDGSDALAVALRMMADAAEPLAITLSQLQRWHVNPVAKEVYVFENPSMLIDAARRGWRQQPPLICLSGWPNTAGLVLLRQLSEAGCTLYYHGDFDPSGLKIALDLVARLGVTPWRMTAREYLSAVNRSRTTFDGAVPATPWDTDLAEGIRQQRRVVFEEDVTDELLQSLVRTAEATD